MKRELRAPLDALARLAGGVPGALLLFDGVLGLVATLLGPAPADRFGAAVLPVDLLDPNAIVQLVGSLGTLALGVGLAREKRLAAALAGVTFGAAAVVQLGLLGHPLGGVVALACLAILVLDRDRFTVRTSRDGGRYLAAFTLAAVSISVVGIGIVVAGLPAAPRSLSLVVESVVAVLSFGTPGPLAALSAHGATVGLVVALARLPLALGAVGVLRPATRVSPERSERALGILRRHGRGALLPFQLGPALGWFESPAHEAVVPYAVSGRFAVALGDPVGVEQDRAATWEVFVASAERDDLVPATYQATDAWAEELRAAGWHTFRVGHEALIDLATFDLKGSARANLRHTVTRAERGGVEVEWLPEGVPEGRDALRDGLRQVDGAWRRDVGPEMQFTISRFGEASLRGPIAVASVDRRPIAFATFVPTGADGGYVLDLMRRVPGSVPGAFESCVVAAAMGLRAAGATSLSLGLAPLALLDAAHGPVEERLLAVGGRAIRRIYDVEGLAFFKRKFAPRWEPRHAVVRKHADAVGLAVALVRLHSGGIRDLVLTGIAAAAPPMRTVGRRRRPTMVQQ